MATLCGWRETCISRAISRAGVIFKAFCILLDWRHASFGLQSWKKEPFWIYDDCFDVFFLRKLISKWGRCRKQLDVGFQRIGTVVHLWPRWRWKKQEVLWTGEPSLVMMASRMGVAGWRRLDCILCLVLYFSFWFFKCGEPIYKCKRWRWKELEVVWTWEPSVVMEGLKGGGEVEEVWFYFFHWG